MSGWWRWLVIVLMALSLSSNARAQEPSQMLAPLDMPDMSTPRDSIVVPPLPPDFLSHSEGWLRLSYPPSAAAWSSKLVEAAFEARQALIDELGKPVLGDVEVRIARDPQELARLAPVGLPPPEYAEGVAYARARLIVISLVAPHSPEPPDLREVLRHELAHVALHDAVGGLAVPRWFNEGFAVHASGESSLVRTRTLWTATLANRVLPMAELDRTFPANSRLAAVAYAQSADFVRFLLRRQDRDRFQMFIERLSRGERFNTAISDAYDADLRRLEFQWREEIRKRYSWAPVLLGGGVIWVAVIGLVGLAWMR
ncbi:MAG TPA: peptidase MA family metallohydrolase, partial [Polyangiaceae bacterium]|nr:peptidase MA family metallohydrolase [Polyangiaceae bacterium]